MRSWHWAVGGLIAGVVGSAAVTGPWPGVALVGAGAAVAVARRRPSRSGTASRWQVARSSSSWAMRRRARTVRPSVADLPWWRRVVGSPLGYATPLCRVGRQTVWTSCEESTLRIGIPGTGKSAELACRIVDAPGAVVVTSTAADLFDLTAPSRKTRGPVLLFNPGGLGGLETNLRWSPLVGCADPATARRRATDLMGPGTGSAEGERWDVQGRRVLAVLLHAAALGGHRMRTVADWVSDMDSAKGEILTCLDKSPAALEQRIVAEQIIRTNPRTRDGVLLAIAPALEWTALPAAAVAGDAKPDEVNLDVAALVDQAGALYLLGDHDGAVAPLVAALTAELVHQARRVAAVRPGGRLDPALTLALDEIALVCPVPLDSWLAELRKRSIVIHAACQGLGQLRDRWGEDKASMILNSCAAVLVFGGCKDPTDLKTFADLGGMRDETVLTRDATGAVTSKTARPTPVVDVAKLANLPNFQALLIRRGMPVAWARTPIAWKRRDLRRSAK